MNKLKQIKSENIFPVIKGMLDNGTNARITVTGMSMYPFLRENRDSVELSPTTYADIYKGDIVVILRKTTKEYVMHRVIKKEKDCFYLVGDAQQFIEGPLYEDQLFAKVNTVWRKGKKIECTDISWRLLSYLWMAVLPLRRIIFRIHRILRRIKNYL